MQVLASLYQYSEEIWDIGCDHGLLGLSFVEHSEIKRIYLVDPSILVIKQLQSKLNDSDIPNKEKIHIIHSKGQDIKMSRHSKTIFIAGMGGDEIRDILSKIEPALSINDRLIISPHRKILETRHWLHHSNYRLENEILIYDKKQYYQAIVLSLDLNALKVGLYGDKLWCDPLAKEYRIKEMAYLKCHQDEASKAYFAYLEGLSC